MEKKITPSMVRSLAENEIFVFGSNLAGSHGGGAARCAYEHFGAQWGVGTGIQGQSYAIPTMHGGLEDIRPYVDEFLDYAQSHPEKQFLLTRIGCGIAGFRDSSMAPLFLRAMEMPNISIPAEWLPILTDLQSQNS